MYQETVQNKKGSSWIDLALMILILACIVFIKKLAGFFQSLPSPFNTITQVAVFAVIVIGCLWLYNRRLCSYRYTIIHHQPGEGELNVFGEAQKYPYDEGTICFERMVANKGRIIELILPSELLGLLEPGESIDESPLVKDKYKTSFFRIEMYSLLPQKTAHTLLFARKGKLHVIYMHPTETFRGYVRECLEKRTAPKAAENE